MDAYINVKNFGPIEEAEIDLRPLTVFVGESNTGKTYLAALIYALHQQFRGISQLPWSNSIANYFSLVYRLRSGYSQSQQEEIEQEMLEVLEKLNMPELRSNFPIYLSRYTPCLSLNSQIRKTSQTSSNGASTLNPLPS